jgi:hypothetical protein
VFEKLDLWRRHPTLRATHPKHLFPGFGIALGIFAAYFVVDALFLKPKHDHGHGDAHGAHGAHGAGKHH